MKHLIVIETAAELLKFANRIRTDADKLPYIGREAQLFFDFANNKVELCGAPDFVLSDEVKAQDLMDEFGRKFGISIFIEWKGKQ